ncbi:hypothetical protein [uncultured Aquimarina sp.]|uniref:hypothetical protein n=1 Tax=uncultured Aquimarina sp. TaxID=575652 RepID=UPI00262E0B93|nr:hypothetical protein [uncultured Aquimarina sp.]
MSNTKKIVFQILIVFTCFVVLCTSFILLKSRYDEKEIAKTVKYEAQKDVIRDLDYQYAKLKSTARYWSTLYAKITTIHNRDTIEHPKYTVAELPRKHQEIVQFWDRYEDDVYIQHYATDKSYLSEIHAIGDTLRQLSRAYTTQNKISNYLGSLNMAYADILNHLPKTDSVSRYSSRNDPRLSTYFYYLDKIDRAYYELLFEHYPTALHSLIYGTQEFEKDAVRSLIYRQTQGLNNSWTHLNTPETKRFRKHMKAYLDIETDSLNTYIFKKNGDKLLLLVKTLQFTGEDDMASKKAYLNALTEGFHLIKDQYNKEIYVYLEFFNQETFYTDIWIKTPDELHLEIDYRDDTPKILSKFYEVDAYQYYIKGSFSLLDVWYPNRTEQKFLEK